MMPHRTDMEPAADLNYEIAWAAGFFDGEGCFTCWGRSFLYASTKISQASSREALDRFRAVVGVGTVYGPWTPKGNGKKTWWQYVSHGEENMSRILMILRPWLSHPKILQAAAVFEKIHQAQAITPRLRRPRKPHSIEVCER